MVAQEPRSLGSTYRLQLNGIGFAGAAEAVPFLSELGVETMYVSPITQARRGSTHGYDVVDPTSLDPTLGGTAGLEDLLQTLDAHDMRLLVDIVPNHMSATVENRMFRDVLRLGRRSLYASFFDVAWESADNTIVLPVLDGSLPDALDACEIRLRRDEAAGYQLVYRDLALPLDPAGDEDIVTELSASGGGASDPASRRQLELVLARQHYRLVNWRDAARLVNYRRFFDINDLIGIRQEDPNIFFATHALVFELARDPRIAGFRIDHIDGLRDPATYLSALRAELNDRAGVRAEPPAIIVEKILGRGETLPRWPVQGTTGYEFAAAATGLFVDRHGATEITSDIASATGDDRTFAERAVEAKHQVLDELFYGVAGLVTRRLTRAIEVPRPAVPDASLAVEELTKHVEAYRTYRRPGGELSKTDRQLLSTAAAAARLALKPSEQAALDRVLDVLRGPIHPGSAVWDGIASWQQLTAPVAAKGVEDTAIYTAGAPLAAVDVGTDPDRPSYSSAELHELLAHRREYWPDSLNAASTHDSKRSQDVRCRLAALTEIAPGWIAAVSDLETRMTATAEPLPDAADRRYAYETVVGAWPVNAPVDDEFHRRVRDHVVKAAREAKRHTNWLVNEPTYERALTDFVRRLLADDGARRVIDGIVAKIAPAAVTNALAATVLRVAAPGVPDSYQGEDLWHYRLVDPDNRLTIDFDEHRKSLASIGRTPTRDLLADWHDGRVKQAVLRAALQSRRDHLGLFARGDYVPLVTSGPRRHHVFAFARVAASSVAVAVVPRLVHALTGQEGFAVGEAAWGTTAIELADLRPTRLVDVLTGNKYAADGNELPAAELLSDLPVALLIGKLIR